MKIINKTNRKYILNYVAGETTEIKRLVLQAGENEIPSEAIQQCMTHPILKKYIDAKLFIVIGEFEKQKAPVIQSSQVPSHSHETNEIDIVTLEKKGKNNKHVNTDNV